MYAKVLCTRRGLYGAKEAYCDVPEGGEDAISDGGERMVVALYADKYVTVRRMVVYVRWGWERL